MVAVDKPGPGDEVGLPGGERVDEHGVVGGPYACIITSSSRLKVPHLVRHVPKLELRWAALGSIRFEEAQPLPP